MQIERLAVPDVLLITPRRFADARGWFEETWSRRAFEAAELSFDFVQDNQSYSERVGTVRGLHLQVPPHAQAKLVRAVRGRVFDVAVDLRTGSATYGRWVGAELSEENGAQLLIPRGFAHGFCTREAGTLVAYKVDGAYHRDSERGVRFDDPTLAIRWGIDPADATLSDKDRALPTVAELGPVPA